MEDIKRRLEFDNTAIKVQAIGKLVDNVKIASDKDLVLLSDSGESAEVKFLWSKCGDADPVISNAACEAALFFLRAGKAEFSYITNILLNQVPTAKCLGGITKCLVDLLILELLATTAKKEKTYKCPYAIRVHPHPLITVLTNQSRCWPALQQQLQRALSISDTSVAEHIIELLSPVFRFILLEPKKSDAFTTVRVSLVAGLLQAVEGKEPVQSKLVEFLLDIIPALQTESWLDVGEATQIVEAVGNFVNKQLSGGLFAHQLLPQILYMCDKAAKQGRDTTSITHLALNIGKLSPESIKSDTILLQLMRLLVKVYPSELAPLLKLVSLCIEGDAKSNKILLGMLVLPTLQVLSTPNTMACTSGHNINQALASNILKLIDDRLYKKDKVFSRCEQSSLCSNVAELAYLEVYKKLVYNLQNDAKWQDWLANTQKALSIHSQVTYHMTCMVVSLLVVSHDAKVVEVGLDLISDITQIDPTLSPSILPLLMYKLKWENDPQIKISVLNTVPSIATHKIAVPPILKTLQVLGNSPKLRAVALRLITALWKQQDRCFPYLQQMLAETDTRQVGKGDHANELLFAKAACIRDICKERASQHGADMLGPLSEILNKHTEDSESPAVVLSMEGLYHLCEAEVIDIRTAWTVLANKVGQDKRPLVICSICNLFSLVPSLEVNTEEYEEFTKEVVQRLWQLSQHENGTVCGAAFRALAWFSPALFFMKYLPEQVTGDFRKLAIEEAAAESGEEHIVLPDIPGVCYTRILKQLPEETLKDYNEFLVSLVEQEVDSLPRGIHHSSVRRHNQFSAQGKAVASIPAIILELHEKNKQPVLTPSIAMGLLFSYDPPLPTGRDGNPRRHHIIQHGRTYHQMMYTLLTSVSLQSSEWHQCLLAPQAWTSFVERGFIAYVECRKAELQLQLEKGQVGDSTENQLQQDTVWLWARDKLTDLIKSSSKGAPSVQGNCLCALAALAVAVSRYVSGLDVEALKKAETASEYLSQSHWNNIVCNTLLTILDPSCQGVGRTLPICQLRSGSEQTTTALLARGGACLAFSQIIPLLITSNTDVIYQLLDSLMVGLPGVAKSDDKPILQFYCGLGLGMILARLFEEHFADVAGTQGMISVWKAVDALESSSFGNSPHKASSLFGLSACLSAMCAAGKTDTKVHVCSIYEQLLVTMEMTDTSDSNYEGLCFCMAILSGSAYVSNILLQDMVDRIVAKLYQDHCSNPQSIGLCLSLGAVCSALLRANHPTVGDLVKKLSATWLTGLADKDIPTIQRIAYLHGAMGIAGLENSITQLPSNTSQNWGDLALLVQCCSAALVRGTWEVGLTSHTAWMLGALHMATTSVEGSRSSVPLNYYYLPETSVIRALVDVINESSKLGPEGIKPPLLQSALMCLEDGPCQPLPPINWAGLLSPIMRMPYGDHIQKLCIQLAIKQSSSSPSAAMFLASWLISPLYDSLSENSQLCIFENLPVLIKTVSVSKLKEYFERGFLQPVLSLSGGGEVKDTDRRLSVAAVKGLCAALGVRDPPQAITLLLYQTLETLYSCVPKTFMYDLYIGLASCLQEVPDQVIDKMIGADLDRQDTVMKGCLVRCYLCSKGLQSINMLNDLIEVGAHMATREKEISVCLFQQCFLGCYLASGAFVQPTTRMRWLLELMGHIRSTALGVKQQTTAATEETIEYLLAVFTCAVSAWCSDKSIALLSGMVPFDKETTDPPAVIMDLDFSDLLLQTLPQSLSILLRSDPWSQMCPKVMDWLIALHEAKSPLVSLEMKAVFKRCLLSLRHTDEFAKMIIWSRVYCL